MNEKLIVNNNNKNYYNKAYDNLYNLLSNPETNINNQTQINIESTLNNLCSDWFNNKVSKESNLGISLDNLSKDLQELLVTTNKDLKDIIRKYKSSLTKKIKGVKNKSKNDEYIHNVYQIVDTNQIISIILTHYLRWVSYNDTSEVNYQYLLNISTKLGSTIFNVYLYNMYILDNKNDNVDISFSNWKENNIELCEIYNNKYDQHLDNIFGNDIINMLITMSLINVKNIRISNNWHNVIVIPSNIKSMWKKSNLFVPLKLPMIVPPKEFKRISANGSVKEVLGGYLTNDIISTDRIFIPKAAYKINSKHINNDLINTVNNMSCIPYKINTSVLEFIINKGDKFGMLLDIKSIEKIKDNNYDIKKDKWSTRYFEQKYKSEMSKYLLEFNILNVANIFKELYRIYFPVRLDQRGRIYCVPNYLNYQSNDLSKSLLLFSNESTISRANKEAIDFFKIYGANCYGNGIDKKSYLNRITWVDDNKESIYNFEKNDILKKAKNKHLFLAFCIEYKKFYEFEMDYQKDDFKTCLPIQLDATCNGFQHLSLLSNETKLYETLNLETSDNNKQPKDFYSYILIRLLDILKYRIQDTTDDKQPNYERLYNFVWERSNIKHVIMTIPYNATRYAMENYLKETLTNLDKIYLEEDGVKNTWYVKNNQKINNQDIHILIKIIMTIVNVDFENISKLRDYLKAVAELHNVLNMAITWSLPSGLIVTQSYLQVETVKIKPFSYSKSRLNLSRSNPNIYDKSKQKVALMPNLIHSLDATTLTLLFLSFVKTNKDNHNFYAIHDCFATTADKMGSLISILKSVYVKLYSDEPYLRKFDNYVINTIKYNYEDNIEWIPNERAFLYEDKKYKIPNLDWVFSKNTPSFNNPYLVT